VRLLPLLLLLPAAAVAAVAAGVRVRREAPELPAGVDDSEAVGPPAESGSSLYNRAGG
jgi:hypothetical protein